MIAAARTWFNNLHINTQLMVVITLLNIIDFLTTKILVDWYGFEAEANPVMYHAMVMMGSVWGLAVVKIITLAFMWTIYDAVEHHHRIINPGRMTYILGALTAAFFALITWNFSLVAIGLLS